MKTRTFFVVALMGLAGMFASCQKEKSATTGWNYNDKENGGFEKPSFVEMPTGPNLVYVPGGAFTMGMFEQDVTYEADALPRKVTVSDFYMDQTEVSNLDYREYLYWLKRVYIDYPEVEEQAKPDTLVWRDRLAFNEPYVRYYFRHPAYNDYPVVGVTWVQATNYCKWRTDRVNEGQLVKAGVINHNPQQVNEDNFNTEAYLVDQYQPSERKGMKNYDPNGEGTRDVKMEDGILLPDYRLPTEAEWEYAALALQGTATFENVNDRQIYPWEGISMRQTETGRYQGKMMTNFQRGRGDFMGISEEPNDAAQLTAPVKSYWPNAFGLYNMGGNVSEWVMDVYRPLSSTDVEEMNSFRGNVYTKVLRDQDGYVAEKDSLGRIIYVEVTEEENANRRNYKRADNIGYRDEMSYNDGMMGYDYGNATLISNQARVYKGGSWEDRAFWTSPGARRFLDENMGKRSLGFRCAMTHVGDKKDTK